MIGYTCKYTPVELLAAYGGEPELLSAEAPDFSVAEEKTHGNLCSHAKALLEQCCRENVSETVLMDCCDSVRRVADVLERENPAFFRLLGLPRHQDGCAKALFAGQLRKLASEYGAYRGTEFDEAAFRAAFHSAEPLPDGPWIGVLGARIGPELLSRFRAALPYPVVDLTCGGNRALPAPPEALHGEALLDWYAGELLCQTPCMRMDDRSGRRALLEKPGMAAIVYHTVKFCDYYAFEYADLKEKTKLPMLKLESDFTPLSEGQLSTRLRAFAEKLAPEKGRAVQKGGLIAGIDSGSTTTNVVVLDEAGNVAASAIVRTGPRALVGAQRAFEEIEKRSGIRRSDIARIVATGYGRGAIDFADEQVTEITCHARGAHFLHPAARTIIDIGGQDSKVICLDENGAVKNFVMNDKCAAGTGRFLELMARTLEMTTDEFSRRGLESKKDLTISSMCTVFAESEVVSLIAENHPEEDIIHGLCKAVASKTRAIVLRAGGVAPYMMTGGVARNRCVVRALEAALDAPVWVAPEPDLCGALGAALTGK